MRQSAAILHIQHMASLGLPPRQAIPAMVDALQFIIPSSVNTFVWLGENGQPVDLYERHPIPEALDAFMMQTPMLEATGQPSFAKLVNAPLEYGNWWQFTAHDGWDRSVMKNELFRPYNIGNNMDFLLKDRNRPVALLTINREPFSAPFRRREIDAVLALRPHFLHAMRANETGTGPNQVFAEGLVATAIVDRQGRILSKCPSAGLFLHQLNGRDCKVPITAERVPQAAQTVIDRLAKVASTPFSPPAADDINTPWCIMRVAAHAMDDGQTIVLSLQRYLPINILRLHNVAQAPLSPSERRVAYLMCSELENQEIASAVGVTEATMREYSKRIRAKLGASNRDAIRAGLSRMMPAITSMPNAAW